MKTINRSERCTHPQQSLADSHIEDARRFAKRRRGSRGSRESPQAARHYGDTSRRARRLTSSHFVGRRRADELELAAREAARGTPDAGPARRRVGRRQDPAGRRARAAAGRRDCSCCAARRSSRATASCRTRRCMSALRPLVRGRHPALDALGPESRPARGAAARARRRRRPRRPARPVRASCACSRRCSSCSTSLGERQPLVLILEDMHWADRSTRTFVAFLARSLRQERVLLRAHLPHRRAPPPASTAPAARRARAARARAPDRARAVRPRRAGRGARATSSARSPARQLVERLYERSEGNPLYTEELLAAGLDGRGAAPAEPARRVHAADRAPVGETRSAPPARSPSAAGSTSR